MKKALTLAIIFLASVSPVYAHAGEFQAYKGFPLLALAGLLFVAFSLYEKLRDTVAGVGILANAVFVAGYMSVVYTKEEVLETAPLLNLTLWVPILAGVLIISFSVFAIDALQKSRARQ